MKDSQHKMRARRKEYDKRKIYVEQPLTLQEQIKDIEAKIRMCKSDLKYNLANKAVLGKIQLLEEKLQKLNEENSTKEVTKNGY